MASAGLALPGPGAGTPAIAASLQGLLCTIAASPCCRARRHRLRVVPRPTTPPRAWRRSSRTGCSATWWRWLPGGRLVRARRRVALALITCRCAADALGHVVWLAPLFVPDDRAATGTSFTLMTSQPAQRRGRLADKSSSMPSGRRHRDLGRGDAGRTQRPQAVRLGRAVPVLRRDDPQRRRQQHRGLLPLPTGSGRP